MSPFPGQGSQLAKKGASKLRKKVIPDSAKPTNSKPVKDGVGAGMSDWDRMRTGRVAAAWAKREDPYQSLKKVEGDRKPQKTFPVKRETADGAPRDRHRSNGRPTAPHREPAGGMPEEDSTRASQRRWPQPPRPSSPGG